MLFRVVSIDVLEGIQPPAVAARVRRVVVFLIVLELDSDVEFDNLGLVILHHAPALLPPYVCHLKLACEI